MIRPVILSGGSGTRLWPLSRELYPKQFLPLSGEKTMIQETILRLDGLENVGESLVVCNEDHRYLAAEQLRLINRAPEAIILEPLARNTAPAIAAAAFYCHKAEHDDILLVLPADHVITNVKAFHKAVRCGIELAEKGHLVTFGIVPDHPETGYGYIKAKDTNNSTTSEYFPIERFVEKPDLETARSYFEDGGYYWNSGMFLFKASAFIDELQKLQPQVAAVVSAAVKNAQSDTDFTRLAAEDFAASPSISIDYAVMEKTEKAVVIPLDAGWNDIGSWAALSQAKQADESNNVCFGDVIATESSGCYLRSSGRLVAAVGLENHIVVETADAVLVAHKDSVQNVKQIVESLKKAGRSEAANHLRVSRPWGTYETVDLADRYQVKRITVKPGASLSMQMHHHRAEHWVVVKGTARITKGDEILLLTENQSTYIPLGITHRLENPGKIPLELIEVQSGSYLCEDDIIRFEDNFGRA